MLMWGVASSPCQATPPELLTSPANLRAFDVPNDDGTAVDLTWELPEAARAAELSLWRTPAEPESLREVAEVPAGSTSWRDTGLAPGRSYRYLLLARRAGLEARTPLSEAVSPRLQLFNRSRVSALVLFAILCTLVLGFILRARRGGHLFLRRIAGLSALDEAVGRATEMGRKIIYVPGVAGPDDPQTVASLAVLKHVARSAARHQAGLEVPNRMALTFAAARETVKEAYLEAGRPDLYREEMVYYVTQEQFAYAAVVAARMARERPAAHLLIGWFAAESLLLAEAGQTSGAIQIAGTAEISQLPFLVVACDYTLVGEELFAASAGLSGDPATLGSIKGQDYTKLVVMLVIVVGIVLESAGVHWLTRFLTVH